MLAKQHRTKEMKFELETTMLKLVVLLVIGVAAIAEEQKRFLEDSEINIVHEVVQLKQELLGLKANVTAQAQEIKGLKQENVKLKATASAASGHGSVYTRWGRTSCPGNNSELIYSGFMAGSKWTSEVGTSSYLCLPHDVTWGNFHAGVDAYNTHIFGTEMDFHNSATILGKNVYNQNAPCAVCRTTRSSALMIPARTGCFPGWTLEYSGYLVSNYPGGSISTEAVCIDGKPEVVDGHGVNEDESVIHLVEARCGSLSCPPYVDGRELACVVCSK